MVTHQNSCYCPLLGQTRQLDAGEAAQTHSNDATTNLLGTGETHITMNDNAAAQRDALTAVYHARRSQSEGAGDAAHRAAAADGLPAVRQHPPRAAACNNDPRSVISRHRGATLQLTGAPADVLSHRSSMWPGMMSDAHAQQLRMLSGNLLLDTHPLPTKYLKPELQTAYRVRAYAGRVRQGRGDTFQRLLHRQRPSVLVMTRCRLRMRC